MYRLVATSLLNLCGLYGRRQFLQKGVCRNLAIYKEPWKKQKKKGGGVAPNKTNKKFFEKVFILLGAVLGAIWSIMGPKYFKYFPMAKIFEPLPALLVPSTIV